MRKRILSAGLWLYAGWTFGTLLALTSDLNALIGPIVGIVAAIAFVAVLPRLSRTRNDLPASRGKSLT